MKRILVVDNNLMNLQLIGAQLEGEYEVVLAKSGSQALQICIRKTPDLLLLNIKAPEVGGFEAITRLKQDIVLNQIPVIVMAESRDPAFEVQTIKAGAVDFISQPVEREILLHRLELHLRLASYQRLLENKVKDIEDNVINSFSDMIEYRDENTGGHIERTSKYVGLLGQTLREKGAFSGELSEKALEWIVRAVPLHDVGKIGVSDVILLKPSTLDNEEFGIMKTHTIIGADMLRNMYKRSPDQHYLEYAIMIAESHHERYDGKGYPYGLKKEEIPLCARLMSLADVYDTLVGIRVYKKSMNHSDACRIVCAGTGTQFDPRVVDAFQAVHPKFAEVAQQYWFENQNK